MPDPRPNDNPCSSNLDGRLFVNAEDKIKALFGQLAHFRASGTGFVACCPSHKDRQPSLSITAGSDGRILVHCHAGCDLSAVMQAMGLQVQDLFSSKEPAAASNEFRAKPGTKSKSTKTYATVEEAEAAADHFAAKEGSKRVASWDYHTADGQLVGRVIRYDETHLPEGSDKPAKFFRPVSRQPGGRWVVQAMPTPRPLYRLADLLRSTDIVFLGEGEKATEVVLSLDLTATTFAGGAKAVQRTDFSPLAGRTVAILPDNDEAGEQCTTALVKVLAELQPCPVVKVVRLRGLPAKGDAVEFVSERRAEGKDNAAIRAELEEVVERAQPVTLDPKSSAEWQPPIPLEDVPDVPPFPLDVFSESLQDFVSDAAEALPCPPDYVAVPLLVMAGGMIGASRALAIKNKHIQRASLYAAVIGSPGTAKTPALETVVEHINEIEEQIQSAWNAAMDRYEDDLSEYEAKKGAKAAKTHVRKQNRGEQ